MKSQLHLTAGVRGGTLFPPICTRLTAQTVFFLSFKWNQISFKFPYFPLAPSSTTDGLFKETFFLTGFMGARRLCGQVTVCSQLVCVS